MRIRSLLLSVMLLVFTTITNAQNSCTGYRTQTQGGWASTPNGSNPGTYLNNKFALAFPTGLEIGCTNKLRLTSPTAVRNYLPQTSTPKALPAGTLTNPSRTAHQNVLAGQLITLALNLGFDNYDVNFAPASTNLKDLFIATGPFALWSVQRLFTEANKKIGGCSTSTYSFSQFNDALNRVNLSYDNGVLSGSYLACPLEVIGLRTNLLCYGDNSGSIDITPSKGIPPYSYIWSNGATTQDISGLSAGPYSVTVSDQTGTTKSLSFTITQPNEITLSVTSTNVSCNGDANGTITASASAGTILTVNGQSYSASALYGPGPYTVTATTPNSNNTGVCTKSQTVTIIEPIAVTINATSTNVTCYGLANGTITATASAGATITINGDTYNSTAQYDAGEYLVTATTPNLTNNGNCTSSIVVTITQPSAPLSIDGSKTDATICSGANCNGSATITLNGGTTPYSISWSNGATDVTSINNVCATNSLTVAVLDFNGCSIDYNFGSITCNSGCDPLKTFTQGGWGAVPNGANPGVYLHANFDAAFPNGLTIGCTNTLILTSAQAITDWLPSGTTPSVLPAGNMTDDLSYDNVFAAQLVAATLNVGFDAYDDNFTPSADLLGNRYFTTGTFAGWSLNEVIEEANNVIGGCSSNYSEADLNSALDVANNNYDNGTQNNGALGCESSSTRLSKGTTVITSNIYPNPATDIFNIDITAANTGDLTIEIVDVMGRTVQSYLTSIYKGLNHFALETKNLNNQVYVVRISNEKETKSTLLMVKKP